LDKARQAQQAVARQRMRQDASNHPKDELVAAEQLYQVANKNWRSPEAKACLEQMVEKYPDLNRTGCAILYLAQMATGEDKVKLLDRPSPNMATAATATACRSAPTADSCWAFTT
jgi:hypothetical protein